MSEVRLHSKEKKRRAKGEGAIFFRPKSITIQRNDPLGEEACAALESAYRSDLDVEDRIVSFSLRLIDGACAITPRTERKNLPEIHVDDPRLARSDALKLAAQRTPKGGLWVCEVDLGRDDGGKRVRRTIYGKSEAEVKRKVTDLKAEHGGTIRPRAQGTVGEWVERWLENDVRPNRAANTYALYETMWRVHAAPLVGHIPLEKFGVKQVENLYARLRAEGVSSSASYNVARTLSRAFEVAIRRRAYNQANPFVLVEKPRHRAKEARILDEEAALRFIEAARGDRYEAMWLLMLTGGLRVSEVLGLEWQDIDFKHAAVTLRQGVVEVRDAPKVGPLKTAKSRRKIDIGDLALDALRCRRAAAEEEGHGSSFVFTTTVGTHPCRSPLRQRHFEPICAAAGITGLTIHGLRHTMTSLALPILSPHIVASRLGHASTRMTLDRYGHLLPGAQRQAADAIESLLKPKKKNSDDEA